MSYLYGQIHLSKASDGLTKDIFDNLTSELGGKTFLLTINARLIELTLIESKGDPPMEIEASHRSNGKLKIKISANTTKYLLLEKDGYNPKPLVKIDFADIQKVADILFIPQYR